jgi:hypothetical protein
MRSKQSRKREAYGYLEESRMLWIEQEINQYRIHSNINISEITKCTNLHYFV